MDEDKKEVKEVKTDELVIKKGFEFYCSECNKFYRWKQLKVKLYDLFNAMTCPVCGNWVEDLKRK